MGRLTSYFFNARFMFTNSSTNASTTNRNNNHGTLDGPDSASQSGSGNFSLIAKYFASFPATRLKAQSPVAQFNTGSEASSGGHTLFRPMLDHSSTPAQQPQQPPQQQNGSKSTPFLPFKKPQISKTTTTTTTTTTTFSPVVPSTSATANSVNTAITPDPLSMHHHHQHHHNHNHHHAETADGIQFNLRSSANNAALFHNTDHLCTNFKRMIKLNDQQHGAGDELNAGSPQTAASNTPTGLLDSDSCGEHVSSSNVSNHSNGDVLVAPSTSPGQVMMMMMQHQHQHQQQQQQQQGNFGDSLSHGATPIFGQITMETRSTRKFLIKHHPYLQMNHNVTANCSQNERNQRPNGNNAAKQQAQPQMRPSINLIKMKKLIYNNANSASIHGKQQQQQQQQQQYNSYSDSTAAASSPVLHRNGRCSRSNQVI